MNNLSRKGGYKAINPQGGTAAHLGKRVANLFRTKFVLVAPLRMSGYPLLKGWLTPFLNVSSPAYVYMLRNSWWKNWWILTIIFLIFYSEVEIHMQHGIIYSNKLFCEIEPWHRGLPLSRPLLPTSMYLHPFVYDKSNSNLLHTIPAKY